MDKIKDGHDISPPLNVSIYHLLFNFPEHWHPI